MKSEADRKWHSRLESVMSISWFVMDCFWMNGWLACASWASLVGLLSLFGMHVILHRAGDIKAEVAQFLVACWFMMNMLWMMSDIDIHYKDWARLFMCIAIVMTLAVGIVDSSLLKRFRRKM